MSSRNFPSSDFDAFSINKRLITLLKKEKDQEIILEKLTISDRATSEWFWSQIKAQFQQV